MTVTEIASVELEPGQTAQLNVDGATVSLQVTTPEPEVAPHVPMFGMEGANGQPTVDIVAQYAPSDGRKWTMRDFGADTTGNGLTDPTKPNTGKIADTPANCILHMTWKDSPDLVAGFLDTADPARLWYLGWWHEVNRTTPSEANTKGYALAANIAAHPNRDKVLGNGPIVTRYWLDESNGDAALYGYAGMTFYGVDCYSRDKARYWTPEELFGVAFGKIRAAFPGIRIVVPEMGLLRTTADTTGQGRAQALRDYITYLKAQPDVDYVNYWNNSVVDAGVLVDYRIMPGTPEALVWQEVMGH